MGSIPKIVSTPLKWASKKILHQTLLKFPGGDPHPLVACVYCPEMCRFSCPSAVVSGNDAVTPCNKMTFLYKSERWPEKVSNDMNNAQPLWPIYDCTGCGRCTEYCLYDMPIMQKLFEARKRYPWETAKTISANLTLQEDPVGDLADELGDDFTSKQRLSHFIENYSQPVAKDSSKTETSSFTVSEPKSAYFLIQKGYSVDLRWEKFLNRSLPNSAIQKLKGKRWLLHESSWFNRHLNKSKSVENWVQQVQQTGIEIYYPFAHGPDCIDCGGEGAYSRLFPAQAIQMAKDLWERDQERADGILCFSKRCSNHFRSALQIESIFNIEDLLVDE